MRKILFVLYLLVIVGARKSVANETPENVDVCIYGATSAGIMAACAVKSEGKSVLLIEPSKRIGGMTTGGLGWTDIYHNEILKGYALKFYQRVGAYYGESGIKLTFEPKVALSIFRQFLSEAGINDVLYQHRIIGVTKNGSNIDGITLEDVANTSLRKTVRAKVFLDCSYEGDLMARAGVKYVIGRESNATYGETANGVQMLVKHQFPDDVDPYKVKGDPASGLLYGILPGKPGSTGEGDSHVQAYNFRITLTNDAANAIPVDAKVPDNYDPSRYELLIRLKEVSPWKTYKDCLKWSWMPNHKTDINNEGAFSTDMIGASWNYPEATYSQRDSIYQAHVDYTKGLFYFLWTDPRIPESIRKEFHKWGWPKDEYEDNDHFTPTLYIRESRRMVGRMVMTEDYCTKKKVVNDPIGLADYTMDSHNCGRYVVNGMVKNEGDVQVHLTTGPYNVSYRAVTPEENQARNLIVPVCLSASHIAFGSIRMEPVYMSLGETCGLAACDAIDNHGGCVQDVDPKQVMMTFEERNAASQVVHGDFDWHQCADLLTTYHANIQRIIDMKCHK